MIPNPKLGNIDASVPVSSYMRKHKGLEESDIAYIVTEHWKASREYYSPERSYTWRRNQHFVYGRQWTQWNPIQRRWFPRLPVARDYRVTSNHLLGRVTQMAAKLVSSRPTFSVLPMRADMDARGAAKLAEKILDYDWRALDLFEHRFFAVLHMIMYGIGIFKTWFDPFSGGVDLRYRETLTVGPEGPEVVPQEIVEQTTGKPVPIESATWKGQIRAEAIAPDDFHVPPGIYWPILKLCKWVTHESSMTPEEIYERYKKEITPSDRPGMYSSVDQTASDLDRFTYLGFGNYRVMTNKTPVLEYYEQASDVEGFEKGKVYTVAEDQILDEGDSDFEDGHYPFALFPGVPEPGRFHPHAWVSDLVDPQINHNQTRSRLRKWEALLFDPKVLNPTTSGIPDKQFSSGLRVLNYEAFGGKPEFWSAPVPPNAAWTSMQYDIQDMDKIAMQFGFSRGEQQGGSPSGALAQLLVEADATELGPLLSIHARAWETVGQSILELHRKYSSGVQLLAFAGDGGIADIEHFTKTDIPLGLMVQVQEDSILPRLKSARVQSMRELTREGWFGDITQNPQLRRKLLEYTGQPSTLADVDSPDLDAKKIAVYENHLIIEKGQAVQRRPTDDDQIHVEAMLERANKLDSFEWPPETWKLFTDHLTEHQKSMEQAAQMAEEKQLELQKKIRDIETMADVKGKIGEKAVSLVGGGDGEDKESGDSSEKKGQED